MQYAGACEVCSGYWRMYGHEKRPVTIGKSYEFMAEVRRCRRCGAYWEVPVFSYPEVISREQARKELPDLDALEQLLGIEFPEPPALPPR